MKTDKGEYPDHRLAAIFPLLSEDELDELAADIKTNGLKSSIVLLDDQILDGRNRYRACLRAGIAPIFERYEGDNPLTFVLSQNLHRRHLNESQRALIAARIATQTPGGNRKGNHPANLPNDPPTQEEAAKKLAVSPRSVRTAKAVLERGTQDVVKGVDSGELTVSAAAATLQSHFKAPETKDSTKVEPSGKYAAALDRIGMIIGPKVREAIANGIISNVREQDAIFWAGLEDSEMSDIEELVVNHRWKPMKAWQHSNRIVTHSTTVSELTNRCIANKGLWEGDVSGFRITVTAIPKA